MRPEPHPISPAPAIYTILHQHLLPSPYGKINPLDAELLPPAPLTRVQVGSEGAAGKKRVSRGDRAADRIRGHDVARALKQMGLLSESALELISCRNRTHSHGSQSAGPESPPGQRALRLDFGLLYTAV